MLLYAGERVFAAGLVHSCLSPLSLPPWSRVARRCPPSFRPFGGAEAEAPLGSGAVPDLLLFFYRRYHMCPLGPPGREQVCVRVVPAML
jgi:hypothetical protein